VESRIVVPPVQYRHFAYGPFCEDTSGSRCDAAPGVASLVESRRVLSASGSSAKIIVPSGVSFARLVVCQAIYRSLRRSVPSPSFRFRPRNFEKLQGHTVTPSQRSRKSKGRLLEETTDSA
jgi:hypothetical protein